MNSAKLGGTNRGRSTTMGLGGHLFIAHCAAGSVRSTGLTVANPNITGSETVRLMDELDYNKGVNSETFK